MIIDRNKHPMDLLNQKAAHPSEVKKNCEIHSADTFIVSVSNINKNENYEFETPGFLGTGLFSKKLSACEAFDRLTKGKEVIVNEDIQLTGDYDNLCMSGAHRVIGQGKVKTSLKSMEDLNSFARVEAGEEPVNEHEKVAQMLENLEYKAVPKENKKSTYEILGIDGKAISSTEAAKKLENGEFIKLRERNIMGEYIKKDIRSVASDEQLVFDQNRLPRSQRLEKRQDAYGGTTWVLVSEIITIHSEPSEQSVAFNSVDQLKEFLQKNS